MAEPEINSVWEDNGYGHDVRIVSVFTKNDIRRIEVVRLGGNCGVSYGEDDSIIEIAHLVIRLERFRRSFRPLGTPRPS